jgi:arylsulfatase A-like enzyme
MSILTGLSPLQHRATEHGDVLPEEATTLAEHLSAAGYSTHGISFNFEVKGKTGFAQGFDRFDDFLGKVVDYPDIQQMVRRTEQWLATDPPEPFFLYLHPMNVHGPYRVPKSRQATLLGHAPSRAFEYWDRALMTPLMRKGRVELREQVTPEIVESAIDQYDVAIRYSMEEIARILAALEQAGRLENTLVVLTADHGEEFFEHGGFSHGFTLHREIVHIPLYVHLPGQTEPATDDRIVSQLDLVPTILARAGRPKPAELSGIDLLAGQGAGAAIDAGAEGRPLVQHAGWAERATGLSLVQGSDHLVDLEKAYDAPGPRLALYDLERDLGEKQDRAVGEAAEAERLRGVLRAEADRLAETGRLPDPENILHELDDEDTARLRALGYVE